MKTGASTAAPRPPPLPSPARSGHERWRLHGDSVVGAWVMQGRNTVAELGVVAGEYVGDPRLMETATEPLFCVLWEHSPPSYATSSDLLEGDDPAGLRLLPVIPSTGRPAMVFVAGGGQRHGECGVVVRRTAKGYHVRFLPELDEHGRRAVRSSFQAFGPRGRRLTQYSIEPATPATGVNIANQLVRLLTELDRRRLVEICPEHGEDFEKLSGSTLTLDEARPFVGRPLSRLFHGVSYPARVTGVTAGPLGHVGFDVLYEDGDTAQLTPRQLADSLTWERIGVASPALQRNRGGPARPRRNGPPVAPTDPVRVVQTRALPLGADGPALRVLSRPLAVNQLYADALHDSRLRTEAQGQVDPASGAAARSPPLPPPAARPRTQEDYVPQFLDEQVYADLRDGVLEGLDARLQDEFLATHPLIPRGRGLRLDLVHAESFMDRRWGTAPKARKQYASRWDVASAEDTARLRQIVNRFGDVKASTQSTYTSNRVGYEQCCARLTPPFKPYPLTAEAVGTWLLRRWAKGLKSNLNNTKPLISSLTHYAVHVRGEHLDVSPYPGMATAERLRLRKLCSALAELEDQAVRRSIPLTIQLLRLIIGEEAVKLDRLNAPRNKADLEAIRDVARYGLCRVAMLRRNDTEDGKLKVGSYRLLPDAGGRLMVAPGKAHSANAFAKVPGVREPTGSLMDWLSPGYAMQQWLLHYQRLAGVQLADYPMWPLFPELDDGGLPTRGDASSDGLQATVRRWVAAVGLPEAFVERVTLHGFRSGGCSDAVNSGEMSAHEIRDQGRWTSNAFQMYIHLKADAVRETLRDVINEMALTRAEKKSRVLVAQRAAEQALVRKWADRCMSPGPSRGGAGS